MASTTRAVRPQITIEILTPEEATRILRERACPTRGTTASVLAHYCAESQLGRWKFNGDVVRFDSNGNLIDGQLRLPAHARLAGGETDKV